MKSPMKLIVLPPALLSFARAVHNFPLMVFDTAQISPIIGCQHVSMEEVGGVGNNDQTEQDSKKYGPTSYGTICC